MFYNHFSYLFLEISYHVLFFYSLIFTRISKCCLKHAKLQNKGNISFISFSKGLYWSGYFGIQSNIPFFNMKIAIDDCLNDLSVNSNFRKQKLESIMRLTPQRTKNYSKIDKMLESHGVHSKDRIVTLDGHDFACNSVDSVDFITFDEDCFNGAKSVQLLCFNSVKGKNDFKPS